MSKQDFIFILFFHHFSRLQQTILLFDLLCNIFSRSNKTVLLHSNKIPKRWFKIKNFRQCKSMCGILKFPDGFFFITILSSMRLFCLISFSSLLFVTIYLFCLLLLISIVMHTQTFSFYPNLKLLCRRDYLYEGFICSILVLFVYYLTAIATTTKTTKSKYQTLQAKQCKMCEFLFIQNWIRIPEYRKICIGK